MTDLSERYSGVLLHPTSFPSPYGIGDFGKSAYDFIDFLKQSGQKIWQILPLGPTGYGDSPYQSFSAFAGQWLLISPDLLVQEGLLRGDNILNPPSFDPNHIYYGSVIPYKEKLLKKSYQYFCEMDNPPCLEEFEAFCQNEAEWLDDYALFMAGKDYHGGASWLTWKDSLRSPNEKQKKEWKKKLADSIRYYQYIQFLFFRQWFRLRAYAKEQEIIIVGDIPIFVALDSADVWANRELFQLEEDGYPSVVAGVPPDYFSETGQLWGNPLYDWDYHKETGYDWWIRRIQGQIRLVDYVRIDHFRGFEAYYAIPYGAETAVEGEWRPGPGVDLFQKIREVFGEEIPIWAEDLGIITDEVEALRDGFDLPGMKVLQFAFEDPKDNDMMPYRFTTSNCICYTGTHDNATTMGWYLELPEKTRDRIRRYLNTDGRAIHFDLIRAAMGSIAKYSIYPLQDLLGFGNDCRMNTPSVPSGNGAFRYRPEHLSAGLAEYLRSMTELFGRCEPLEEPEEADDAEDPNMTECAADPKQTECAARGESESAKKADIGTNP